MDYLVQQAYAPRMTRFSQKARVFIQRCILESVDYDRILLKQLLFT